MTKEKTIGTREVSDYLQVPYQTFNMWIHTGILGDRLIGPGKGNWRSLALEDVTAARIVRDVMSFGCKLAIAKECVKIFRQGSTEDFDLAVQSTEEDGWSIFWSRPGLRWKNVSTLVIPVKKIAEEIEKEFVHVAV